MSVLCLVSCPQSFVFCHQIPSDMPTTLVSTAQLAAELANPGWVVFDCRFTLTDPQAGRAAYNASHIVGARYADLNQDLSSPVTALSGRHPLPDPQVLCDKLGTWGVGSQTQVVIYDDSYGSMAVRLWWLLRWLGHEQVALLNGGLPKWMKEKHPVSDALPVMSPKVFSCSPRPDFMVDAATVESISCSDAHRLIDARPEQRFTGEREPLDAKAGHIPGAVNWVYEENLDFDGTYLPPDELRENYSRVLNGVSPENVVHTCGSGVTASHNILAMEIAGLSGSRLYPGSWSEWITDPTRPIATGDAVPAP
jgi:thiosulfate/3-mercaptopyruvate sulfurtransferase